MTLPPLSIKIYKFGSYRLCPMKFGPCPHCGRPVRPRFRISRFADDLYITIWRTQWSVRRLR